MADVPAQVNYGRVVARLVSFRADGPDAGQVPDEIPLSGTVTLTPTVDRMRWPQTTPPRIAVIERIVCPVIGGDLYTPGTEPGSLPATGVWVVATVQPDAEPDRVQWTASFKLDGVAQNPSNVRFEVPDGGTVDLAVVVPADPGPGTVTVVSSEDRIRAEAAATAAEATLAEVPAEVATAVTTELASQVPTAVTAADIPGKVAAALAAQAGNVIRGTGMPNGAVAATPGTLYVDTASTNGASVWRKASGTGTSGWVVLNGDTGWRDMSGIIVQAGSFSALRLCRIRRINSMVILDVSGVLTAISTATSSIPAGFRIGAGSGWSTIREVFAGGAGAVQGWWVLNASGSLTLSPTAGSLEVAINRIWATDQVWPTTLPGTPA